MTRHLPMLQVALDNQSMDDAYRGYHFVRG